MLPPSYVLVLTMIVCMMDDEKEEDGVAEGFIVDF
jgi:hypothetical protein